MSQVNRLERDLGLSTVAVPKIVKEEVQQEGRTLANRMRTDAPKRTGELADSVYVEDTSDGFEAGARADHARYVEFGTVNMAPQPFAFNNVDQSERDIASSLEDIPIL